MTHYIAIVEEEPGKAVGVWFPDLPGCFSAGSDIDEAMRNAPEAVELYAETLEKLGREMPEARTILDLRRDPEARQDMAQYAVVLIPFRAPALNIAAE
jgi:predicted RNase H-like HicB family nuclease